ncbi:MULTISPECIES: 2-oxoacid:acceptor oxidoreductase family protein [Oscillospiraceae]|jgi:2-oxoacid:acceptor oxidoreductase, gamma subunit, pyruvate/2-ketoisovalerate family|uniref:2-oxoacid:acceptor oxidoreductase family protein n=1 Tax=Lawsonibacter faecis TaxID=2763052 RepID=A0A8J6MBZ0_9FIRM|nr:MULTISPECIES: 2-oxoacid:acceptor oxidoreductase family protein [Oscillospiraceae]MTQ98270.1 oxidoreductase [Pseudoflavonifractor sp. BIOML-A16]MTR07949.1 oxidoreductase [Pseudoflavonifractor sp. BIOML-A15]MTR33973.1 oxidoreductase [Pseudoflavonifractor sp. BIOML-A14]MTR74961.1 oxidoreductase [Pseudoflavonifractor sp. BIOML-A18]MTS65747.1 oxidoreductase [Pseudoflavonifractor sp. BIOML-A5]MTS73079.1 oxidoreductase [Pseudoflavonifractor sp. BIOML-A8]MTS92704.1 oxidoreductase [Pseudoflavonifr
MADMICAGFGGQGVLTMGLILAKIAMDEGKNVTWIPSYGSEMRGGTANCSVKITDGMVASPFIKHADIVIAMNQPSLDKFMPMLRPGGTLMVNTTIVKDAVRRDDIEVYGVDATEIAQQEQNARGANIVMLGALASAGKLLTHDVIEKGIEAFFASKGKHNPKNAACYERGFACCARLG